MLTATLHHTVSPYLDAGLIELSSDCNSVLAKSTLGHSLNQVDGLTKIACAFRKTWQ